MCPEETGIVFYNYGGGNWAGMGADVNGYFYVRTGGGGSSAQASWCATPDNVHFYTNAAYAPSPANGDNSNRIATTAYVVANQPVGGPYLPLTGGSITGALTVSYGHIMPYRNGATGVCYLGTGDRYIYYDGTNYILGSASLNTIAGRIWGTSDFSAPVTSARIGGHAGDVGVLNTSGLQEPFGGAVHTGATGANFIISPPSGTGYTQRYRYNQVYTGTWWSAGHV